MLDAQIAGVGRFAGEKWRSMRGGITGWNVLRRWALSAMAPALCSRGGMPRDWELRLCLRGDGALLGLKRLAVGDWFGVNPYFETSETRTL